MADESPKKEMAVGISVTLPLSLVIWLDEHTAETKSGKSDVVKEGLELLRAKADSEKAMVPA